jgi:hypothetical protein
MNVQAIASAVGLPATDLGERSLSVVNDSDRVLLAFQILSRNWWVSYWIV